jgi:hypothetical protein
MPEKLIMRGKTASGGTEKLNFGGRTPGYAYRLTDFRLYPSADLSGTSVEMCGSITAGKAAVDPVQPDFTDAGLISVCYLGLRSDAQGNGDNVQVTNDMFYVTQDLFLMVKDVGGSSHSVNWQVEFEKVKLSSSAEAVANFNQFTIYDG